MLYEISPLFYDEDGRKCIGLGDFLYIDSDMHQSYRTVVCVIDTTTSAIITELDVFMKKTVAVDGSTISIKDVLMWVVAARRDLERKINDRKEEFHRDRMRMWLQVAKDFEEPRRIRRIEEIRLACAVRTIEAYCVRVISDPDYRMCRQRLHREYQGLMVT